MEEPAVLVSGHLVAVLASDHHKLHWSYLEHLESYQQAVVNVKRHRSPDAVYCYPVLHAGPGGIPEAGYHTGQAGRLLAWKEGFHCDLPRVLLDCVWRQRCATQLAGVWGSNQRCSGESTEIGRQLRGLARALFLALDRAVPFPRAAA